MTEVIIAGGRIYPHASRPAPVEALLVRDGRVAAAGALAEMRALATRPDVHDLAGGTALPGLADSHLHLLWYGLTLEQINLSAARSVDDIRAAVRRRASERPAGTWITGHGWQQDLLQERRMPTRFDLDEVSADHPVLLRRACGHIAVANSVALRLAGFGPDSPDPPGGSIGRDSGGELTGILMERAVEAVAAMIPQPTAAHFRNAVRRAARAALAAGLTAVHTDDLRYNGDVAGLLDLYRDVASSAATRLRVDLHIDWDYVETAQTMGLATGQAVAGTDALVRIGGAKLFSDGSLGGRTAALRSPYADDPATSGLLIMPPDELARRAAAAAAAGLQPVIHAIGDRAAAVTLDAFAAALAASPTGPEVSPALRRPRLVHAQVFGPDLAARCRELGVVAEIQPKFVTGDMHFAAARLGPERLPHAYAWRSLLEAGIACAGSSDCPIEPIDPLLGIWAAVCRQDMDGQPADGWLPEQRLALSEALGLFTTGVAFANGTEHERGQLAPGFVADLTVLDRDPWHVPPAELRNLQVTQTIIGGQVAYAR